MSKVLISGGTGSIGSLLGGLLEENGFEVAVLSRSRRSESAFKTFLWDHESGFLEAGALEGCDYFVHLAGAGIADKRWSSARKKEIIDSRVQTAELIYRRVKEENPSLKAFISASAVGYYGQVTSTHIFSEADAPGNDFAAQTCIRWEQAADKFSALGIRTVKLRIGMVLMRDGGALAKMAQPIKAGLGSVLGTGVQFMPWIHVDDLARILFKAIADKQMKGVYNAVAPCHTTNAEFTRSLAKALGKKIRLMPAPAWLLRMVLGERSALLLEGSRVSVEKLLQRDFHFQFTELQKALDDLIPS